jgi:transposase
MAAYTRIASAIALDAQAKGELERLTRAPSTPQAKALRARIVLAAAQGLSNQQIAAKFHVSVNTVGKLADSIRGVSVGRAQGRPTRSPAQVWSQGAGKLHRLLLRLQPGRRERWTLDGLARELHMPRSSVYELLLETGSKSRRLPARREPRS